MAQTAVVYLKYYQTKNGGIECSLFSGGSRGIDMKAWLLVALPEC